MSETQQPPEPEPAPKPAPKSAPKSAPPLSLEAAPLTLAELIAGKAQLVVGDLVDHLQDGRAHVRANAVLGLAAVGHGGAEYIQLLRDGDARVARAAAEALVHVASTQVSNVVAIANKLDGVRPEVGTAIARMFSMLIGTADRELIRALDTSQLAPVQTIIDACEAAGVRGLHVLLEAANDDLTRVRINAMRGVSRLGHLDPVRAIETIATRERDDYVSDVRAAARAASGALAGKLRNAQDSVRKSAPPPGPAVPELEDRNLTAEHAAKLAGNAPLHELVHALSDARIHVRINAIRILAGKRSLDDATARSLAVVLRDPEPTVRVAAATALGTVAAAVAAPALVTALGDADPTVVAAAEQALAQLGPEATGALVAGLDTPGDAHGTRVAMLLGRLPDGPGLLRDALASTAVDVRIHAATGLGQLGPRAGTDGLAALQKVVVGANARLRAAVTRAIAQLAPRRRAPARLPIEGFDDRVLTEAQLSAAKTALVAAGAADIAAHLHDVRPHVRANAATAIGLVGGDHHAVAAALRDEAAEVRLAAVRSLDKLGDAVVIEHADALVQLLADPHPEVVAQASSILQPRAIDAALVRGLERPAAESHVLELILARRHAVEILTDAWGRPAAQPAAARGFVRLGKDRLGGARFLLAAARTDPHPTTRELARTTLLAIDGVPSAPRPPAIAGFETELLDAKAFAAPLDAGAVAPFLDDGRPVVRANAATAIGASGDPRFVRNLGALLKDDDVRVRVAAVGALDRLGDDSVVAVAPALVAMLADARLATAVERVLAARKGKVEAALVAGLETDDEAHGLRVAELICALPNAQELLFIAFDGPAQNVTINAGLGIGLLGAKRAGEPGRLRLQSGLVGPITRKHHAMRKALAMFTAR